MGSYLFAFHWGPQTKCGGSCVATQLPLMFGPPNILTAAAAATGVEWSGCVPQQAIKIDK